MKNERIRNSKEKEAFLNVKKNHRGNVVDRWHSIKNTNSATVLKIRQSGIGLGFSLSSLV